MGTFDEAFASADADDVKDWRNGSRTTDLAGRLSESLTQSAAAYLAANVSQKPYWHGVRQVAEFCRSALANGTITVLVPSVLTGEGGGRPQVELMMSPLGEPAIGLSISEGWIDRALSDDPTRTTLALAQLVAALSLAEFNLREELYRSQLQRLTGPALDLACGDAVSAGLQASLQLIMADRARDLSIQIRLAA